MKLALVIIALLSIVPLMAQEIASAQEVSDSSGVQSSKGLRRVKESGKGKGGSKNAASEGGKGGSNSSKGGSKSSKGHSKRSKGGSKGSSKGKGGSTKHEKRVRTKKSPKDSPPEEPVLDPVTCAPLNAAKTSEPTYSVVDIPGEPLATPAPTMVQTTNNPTEAPIPVTEAPSVKELTESPTPAPIPVTDAPFLRTASPTKAPIPVTDAPTDKVVTEDPTQAPVASPTIAPIPITDAPTDKVATKDPTQAPVASPTIAPIPITDAPTFKVVTEDPTQAPIDIPEEPLEIEEESNDDTLLEHICGILELVDAGAHKNPAILRSAITESNPVIDFDWYNYCSGPPNHFLCPNEYETGKICDRENPETATAVLSAYCKPLFKPLEEGDYTDDYRKQCIEHCVNYVSMDRGDCCNFDCSDE